MRTGSLCVLLAAAALALGCGGGDGDGGGGGGPSVAWVRGAGGAGNDVAQAVAVLDGGATIVAGYYSGTATFGPGEPGEVVLTSAGTLDVFVARYEADGSVAWARGAGGTAVDQAFAVAAFADGSCVVTGYFTGVATFGPGEPGATVLTDIDGQGDIFVARYAPDGDLAWAKRAGRDDFDVGMGVVALADGSCVVTGSFITIAVFGPGEPGFVTLNAAGFEDAFLARYNADGTLAWAKRAGGAGTDAGAGIAAFGDGSLAVAGYFQSAATFGPGEAHQQALTSAGILDAFVARYTSSGTLTWVRRAGGTDYDEALAISTAPDSSCLVTGFFRGTSTFGPGEPGETTITSFDATNDVFVARYDAGGALLWVREAGGGAHDTGRSVAAAADGSCVVAGHYGTIGVFGEGEPGQTFHITEGGDDAFLARFASDGTLLWARTAGGVGIDYAFGVAFHADGSIVTCGEFHATILFSPDEPWSDALSGFGGADAFLARYGPDGTL